MEEQYVSSCKNCNMLIEKKRSGRWAHCYPGWYGFMSCDMRITRTKDLLVATPKES